MASQRPSADAMLVTLPRWLRVARLVQVPVSQTLTVPSVLVASQLPSRAGTTRSGIFLICRAVRTVKVAVSQTRISFFMLSVATQPPSGAMARMCSSRPARRFRRRGRLALSRRVSESHTRTAASRTPATSHLPSAVNAAMSIVVRSGSRASRPVRTSQKESPVPLSVHSQLPSGATFITLLRPTLVQGNGRSLPVDVSQIWMALLVSVASQLPSGAAAMARTLPR